MCFGEIEDIAPQSLKVVRPPFGEINSAVKNNVDCPIILWSVDTRDWTGRSAGDIADYIVETAREGDIILLHDIFEESVRGALMAIDTMMENGYTFVTVKELFEKKWYNPGAWKGLQKKHIQEDEMLKLVHILA